MGIDDRFGTRLDEATRKVLERGWRVREILNQPQYKPIPVSEQIAALLAVTSGNFDGIAIEKIREAEGNLRKRVVKKHSDLCARIASGEKLGDSDRETLLRSAEETASLPIKEQDRANR